MKAGEIVTVNVDRVMIHDIFIPFVASKFEEMGFTKLWDADKAVLIMIIWCRRARWMTPDISVSAMRSWKSTA